MPHGARPVAGRTAVFTGVARDCARWLPRVLHNIERLAGCYEAVSFVFAVSDSRDGSAGLLKAWLEDGRQGTVLDLGELAATLPRRTERIAFARNACLDEIARAGWTDRDQLVVLDLDDVLSGSPPVEAFEEAGRWLDEDPARRAVFASASPAYYDIWALRHRTWCPGDCWHAIWGRPRGVSFEAAKFREVFARQIDLPPTLGPIEVASAFGGLGIYRMSVIRGARYRGLDALGRETSEHVAFNEAIASDGGALYVLPALRVRAPREHLYDPADFDWRWRSRMSIRRIVDRHAPPWRRLVGRQ
jgi:hypothetical protein